jgi:hypothetical protein
MFHVFTCNTFGSHLIAIRTEGSCLKRNGKGTGRSILKIPVLKQKPAGPVEFGCRKNRQQDRLISVSDKVSLKFHQFSIRKLSDASNVGRLVCYFTEFTAVSGFYVKY